MKSLPILILIIFSAFCLSSKEDKSNIQFTWGIFHRDEKGKTKLLDLDDDIKLKKNDYFKFYLKPNDNTYLYLLYLSSEGELTVLFPETKISKKNAWEFKSDVYIPGKDEWFMLTLKGPKEADMVYLLAGNKQIKELDVLINKFLNYQGKDISDKTDDIKDQIIQTVKIKIKENSEFSSYSIKPTSTAGGTRSLSLEGYYQEISAEDFYAKVFEIKY